MTECPRQPERSARVAAWCVVRTVTVTCPRGLFCRTLKSYSRSNRSRRTLSPRACSQPGTGTLGGFMSVTDEGSRTHHCSFVRPRCDQWGWRGSGAVLKMTPMKEKASGLGCPRDSKVAPGPAQAWRCGYISLSPWVERALVGTTAPSQSLAFKPGAPGWLSQLSIRLRLRS